MFRHMLLSDIEYVQILGKIRHWVCLVIGYNFWIFYNYFEFMNFPIRIYGFTYILIYFGYYGILKKGQTETTGFVFKKREIIIWP